LCDPPLTPAGGTLAASSACAGCGVGTAGTLAAGGGGCSAAACDAESLCVGLLSVPLVNFSAAGARSALLRAALPPLLAPRAAAAAAAAAAPPLLSVSMSAVAAGMGLVGLLLLLALGVVRSRGGAAASLVTSCLKRVDAFSLRPPAAEGEGPRQRTAVLGGIFTLMGVLTLTT
jgi:hypothetical protein